MQRSSFNLMIKNAASLRKVNLAQASGEAGSGKALPLREKNRRLMACRWDDAHYVHFARAGLQEGVAVKLIYRECH